MLMKGDCMAKNLVAKSVIIERAKQVYFAIETPFVDCVVLLIKATVINLAVL